MDHVEFTRRFPELAKAAWVMCCDAGGSEMFRADHNESLNRILPQLLVEDLELAEAEIGKMRCENPDHYDMALCGEVWDSLSVCSDTLNWVLNMLFGEDAQTKEEHLKLVQEERAKIPADYRIGTNSGL